MTLFENEPAFGAPSASSGGTYGHDQECPEDGSALRRGESTPNACRMHSCFISERKYGWQGPSDRACGRNPRGGDRRVRMRPMSGYGSGCLAARWTLRRRRKDQHAPVGEQRVPPAKIGGAGPNANVRWNGVTPIATTARPRVRLAAALALGSLRARVDGRRSVGRRAITNRPTAGHRSAFPRGFASATLVSPGSWAPTRALSGRSRRSGTAGATDRD